MARTYPNIHSKPWPSPGGDWIERKTGGNFPQNFAILKGTPGERHLEVKISSGEKIYAFILHVYL